MSFLSCSSEVLNFSTELLSSHLIRRETDCNWAAALAFRENSECHSVCLRLSPGLYYTESILLERMCGMSITFHRHRACSYPEWLIQVKNIVVSIRKTYPHASIKRSKTKNSKRYILVRVTMDLAPIPGTLQEGRVYSFLKNVFIYQSACWSLQSLFEASKWLNSST